MHNDWVRQRFLHPRLSPELSYLPKYLLSVIIILWNWDFLCEEKDWDMYFMYRIRQKSNSEICDNWSHNWIWDDMEGQAERIDEKVLLNIAWKDQMCFGQRILSPVGVQVSPSHNNKEINFLTCKTAIQQVILLHASESSLKCTTYFITAEIWKVIKPKIVLWM